MQGEAPDVIETKFFRKDNIDFCVDQGDIFTDIIHRYFVSDDINEYGEDKYKYILIMTQSCDLFQDFKTRRKGIFEREHPDDKIMPFVIACPAYPKSKFELGNHIEGKIMQTFGKRKLKKIYNREFDRYHCIMADGLLKETLIIDFKHYFSISTDYMYQKCIIAKYNCSLGPLFRERLSQRFSSYLSRVGLPTVSNELEVK